MILNSKELDIRGVKLFDLKLYKDDRGSFSDTLIAENVYIDNQVHIAHNVSVGFSTAIAGQTGIAGSAKIGSFVKIGGQVGIAGHISIGDHVEIAAKSGVTKNIDNNQVVAGFPAIDIKKWKKNIIKINKTT